MGMSSPAQGGRSPLWEGGEAGHTQGPAHPSSKSTHLSCPAAGLPVSQEVRRADRKLGNQVQIKGMRDAGDTAISDDPAEQLSDSPPRGGSWGSLLHWTIAPASPQAVAGAPHPCQRGTLLGGTRVGV